MNPAEAVQAHLDLEASESVGMHFGTFQMTTEGIDEPLRALEEACRAKNIPPSRFRTLGFGESVRLEIGCRLLRTATSGSVTMICTKDRGDGEERTIRQGSARDPGSMPRGTTGSRRFRGR